MQHNPPLSESLEDYLETILRLETANKVARQKDIAESLDVQRGSVTGALKALAEKGLVNYEPYSYITLTKKGKKIAREIDRRHTVIKDFLSRVLRIDHEKADTTACHMEHIMDTETVDSLVKFIEFVDNCPRAGADWIDAYVEYCSAGNVDRNICKDCLDNCVANFSGTISASNSA
ncbi:MAG: metal-dependent transcriptional regulator [Thermodesulfobacteriota bacterium]|nr:metal-dependent transcriptional regulator [Thermodesulfobacteriota bacterium]